MGNSFIEEEIEGLRRKDTLNYDPFRAMLSPLGPLSDRKTDRTGRKLSGMADRWFFSVRFGYEIAVEKEWFFMSYTYNQSYVLNGAFCSWADESPLNELDTYKDFAFPSVFVNSEPRIRMNMTHLLKRDLHEFDNTGTS